MFKSCIRNLSCLSVHHLHFRVKNPIVGRAGALINHGNKWHFLFVNCLNVKGFGTIVKVYNNSIINRILFSNILYENYIHIHFHSWKLLETKTDELDTLWWYAN